MFIDVWRTAFARKHIVLKSLPVSHLKYLIIFLACMTNSFVSFAMCHIFRSNFADASLHFFHSKIIFIALHTTHCEKKVFSKLNFYPFKGKISTQSIEMENSQSNNANVCQFLFVNSIRTKFLFVKTSTDGCSFFIHIRNFRNIISLTLSFC